jgi:hypothetical protein
VAIGQFDEATAVARETLQMIEENGDLGYLPEALRLQGRLLRSIPEASKGDAEGYLTQSLELSRRQGALAWELRTAVELAALLADQGRQDSARLLLRRVIDGCNESAGTPDFIAAESLLTRLG